MLSQSDQGGTVQDHAIVGSKFVDNDVLTVRLFAFDFALSRS
jgi:hypothetical protein